MNYLIFNGGNMPEISYFYYKTIVNKLLENGEPKDIDNEYVKKIVTLALLDKFFYNYILNKKFNLKKISYKRAEDIILTSNPKFNKYYKVFIDKIEFWISDNPYFHYLIDFEKMNDTDRINLINHLKELFKNSNFIEI
jgi:hypothetical protein